MEISWRAVVGRRMRRHYLGGTGASTPVDAVRAMCGAHAQVLSAGELSVALRVEDATRESVQQADGLVKSFGPRGTVHLLPLDDLPLWCGALSALPSRTTVPDVMRMTPEQTAEVIAAIGEALAEDDLTVDELTDEVVRRTGPWAGDPVMPAFQGDWPRRRQVAPVLRCVRRWQLPAGAALPGRGVHQGTRPRPGRQLSAPADRRHRRRRLAPEEVRPQAPRHRRAADGPQARPAQAARCRGGPAGRRAGRRTNTHRG